MAESRESGLSGKFEIFEIMLAFKNAKMMKLLTKRGSTISNKNMEGRIEIEK